MKIMINAGFGNGTKGSVVVDTKDFPREYQLCHGSLAIRLEVAPEQPTPEEVVKTEKKAEKRGSRF
jgi:hypothetical protein